MKFDFRFWRSDLMSGLVVFLVALPLCLGIALASGAPLLSGIIAGILGGIVVGALSGSQISVSGPAAGLISIVLAGISLYGLPAFLTALLLAGLFQIVLSLLKAGSISSYFPANVIEGMLAGIGIIIILKEIPHAIGYDIAHEGDFFFIEHGTKHNSFSALIDAVNYAHPGIMLVSFGSILILLAFQKLNFLKKIKWIPAPLVVVIFGILTTFFLKTFYPLFAITEDHLVRLFIPKNIEEFKSQFIFPDWNAVSNIDIWLLAVTIAVVASIETLLSLEAGDKMDPLKRYSKGNQELFAQGIGNFLSGLIGGLPITAVIVRTTANVDAGGKTKLAPIFHGIFLLISVLSIPWLLNLIPLGCLAAILLLIGYKLANPSVFYKMWKKGKNQFLPFLITVLAVVFTDLLKGVGIGLTVSIFFILRENMRVGYFFTKSEDEDITNIKLAQEVSFLNKAAIKKILTQIPEKSKVLIDASETLYIDHDVLDLITEFKTIKSMEKNIEVNLKGFKKEYNINSIH